MKKTLQDQYLLIKEGKGHKGVFLAEAKRDFPHIVSPSSTFEEAAASLKTKSIISENIVGLSMVAGYEPKKKESYETAFENFLAEAAKKKENEDEKVKAEEKKPSKKVEEDLDHNFDRKDDKNPDNLIFDQIMTGYYAEMKDPKNADKTMQELKDIVFKNLQKDPIHYTKDGQFGVKGLGYTTEAPGLGTPKEAKGKYKSSGYGNLNENKELNVGDKVRYKGTIVTVEKKDEVGNLVLKTQQGKTIRANKAQFNTYGSLEEQKLRKVIREMIDSELEEAYQLVNINLKSPKKDRDERDPTDKYLTFDKDFEKSEIRKGNLIVKDDNKIFITKLLHANLGPKAGNSDLRKHLMDRTNVEPAVLGGKEVWKIKGAKINSKGNISVFVPVEKKSIKESIEKDLAAINKEAEHEVLQSKLDKIDVLIDKRKSQLGKLDEDEDMKALTDAKKVKEIQKDIKALEKAKVKVEKILGKTKGKKKEVIDEADAEENVEKGELDQDTVNGITEKYNEIWEKNGIVTDQDIQHIANLYPFAEKSLIVDYLTGYGLETEYDL
jgi:hypothetical protein